MIDSSSTIVNYIINNPTVMDSFFRDFKEDIAVSVKILKELIALTVHVESDAKSRLFIYLVNLDVFIHLQSALEEQWVKEELTHSSQ